MKIPFMKRLRWAFGLPDHVSPPVLDRMGGTYTNAVAYRIRAVFSSDQDEGCYPAHIEREYLPRKDLDIHCF